MAKARTNRGQRLVRVRIACQWLCFIVFAALTLQPTVHSGGEWLFRVDASSVLLASIAAHKTSLSVAFALVLLLTTLVFGRVFCGWACPLGSLGDAIDALWSMQVRGERWHWVKYGLLIVFVVLALGGHLLSWMLDPMGWASRFVSLALFHYVDVGFSLALAAAFVGMHIVFGRRAFCRILCPLGALLGAVARLSTLRRRFRTDACIDCDLCVDHNRSAAIRPRPENYNPMECFQCGECQAVCPTDALVFEYVRPSKHAATSDVVHVPLTALKRRRPRATDAVVADPAGDNAPRAGQIEFAISRRQLLGSAATGVAGVALMHPAVVGANTASPPLRPPGSVPEEQFVDLCIRCTACQRACPTETLIADGFEHGLVGYRAPILSARDGGCEYGCNACGQVCPTGAIQPLSVLAKQTLQLGIARVDATQCLPIAKGKPCMSCSAACPYEAIDLATVGSTLAWGDRLSRPVVNEQSCTGCGLCEAACPVKGTAAIRIDALAHQRPLPASDTRAAFKPSVEGVFLLDPTLLEPEGTVRSVPGK